MKVFELQNGHSCSANLSGMGVCEKIMSQMPLLPVPKSRISDDKKTLNSRIREFSNKASNFIPFHLGCGRRSSSRECSESAPAISGRRSASPSALDSCAPCDNLELPVNESYMGYLAITTYVVNCGDQIITGHIKNMDRHEINQ